MAVLAVGCARLVAKVEAATRRPVGRRAQPPKVRLCECLADGLLDSIGEDVELRDWPLGDPLADELAALCMPAVDGALSDPPSDGEGEEGDGAADGLRWPEEPDAGIEFEEEFAFGFGGGFDEA